MLGSSTLFAPNRQFFPDNFWEKKTKQKKRPPYPQKKQKNSLAASPSLFSKEKSHRDFWETWIQRGNCQPIIPSLYKLASSNPHPQVPRTIASSVTSRCESLCFLLVSTVSTRKEAQSSWGIFTTYQQVHQTYPRSKSKSFAPIQLVPNGTKKKHTEPGRPCRPFRDVVDGICLHEHRWALDSMADCSSCFKNTPFPKKRKNGEEKNTY